MTRSRSRLVAGLAASLRVGVACVVSACLAIGASQGVAPTPREVALPDGSEVVVTDREGDRLLGYGRVDGGELRLSLARARGDVVVVVATPEGRVSTRLGRVAGAGLMLLLDDAVSEVDLVDWLADRGVRLVLDREGGGSDDASADDDRDDDPSGDDANEDDDREDDPSGDDGGGDDDRDDDDRDDDDRDQDDRDDDADEGDDDDEDDDADDDDEDDDDG